MAHAAEARGRAVGAGLEEATQVFEGVALDAGPGFELCELVAHEVDVAEDFGAGVVYCLGVLGEVLGDGFEGREGSGWYGRAVRDVPVSRNMMCKSSRCSVRCVKDGK